MGRCSSKLQCCSYVSKFRGLMYNMMMKYCIEYWKFAKRIDFRYSILSTKNDTYVRIMISLTVVIIPLCICVSNHHVVNLKHI